MDGVKEIAKAVVVGSPLEGVLRRILSRETLRFESSDQYWIDRYKTKNFNSGAGSYGRLAAFKAQIINDFVHQNDIKSAIEFGSGDGNQAALFRIPHYLGVDISPEAVAVCTRRFKAHANKRFAVDRDYRGQRAELALSLDVIYHLIEDDTFDAYMSQLFGAAERYVIVYSSNAETADGWHGGLAHVRHRVFTDWVASSAPNWKQIGFIKNQFPFNEERPNSTSFADFYIYQRLEA